MRCVDSLRWLLLDADGVLQSSPVGWREDLMAMAPEDGEDFLKAVFAAEPPAIRGELGFADALRPVLEAYRVSVPVETVTEVWSRLSFDHELLARIAELQQAGIGCALATNQHDVRVGVMRARTEYAGLDAQFYSSELGVGKPQPGFFTAIVEQLEVSPRDVLFADDRADNVEGAREAGLQAEVFAELAGASELNRILALHRAG